ncbi:MAG: D-alanine--D-alanine ligase [Sedimentisphaerales bacterium]|nr:D-alanine--D-alanine ligase [Sedimentisphaerales bacterium]
MEIEKNDGAKLENSDKKPKVAVLMGGIGSEREISIQSGNSVADALRQAGFDIVTFDINPNNLEILSDKSIDVFFPVLHGEFGEDGTLQQILEDKSLVYAGSGPAASRAAFDKVESKKIFFEAGITTPNSIEFDNNVELELLEQELKYLGDKYVIKPVRQGSSVGICIVDTIKDAIKAAQKTFTDFGDCLIEEFVAGRELTVGILCGQSLPIIEIKPKSGFYNYHAKYVDDNTQYLLDTVKDSTIIQAINKAALDCFDTLGCRHFSRVDFILTNENVAYVLEVNTIPGFTSHSLLPKAAAKAGFPMSQLCKKIVESAYLDIVETQS